jgi:hypothetical protein
MPTIEDVYEKFGMVSEAAQLLETELGTALLVFGVQEEGLIKLTLEAGKPVFVKDSKRAAELLSQINRQTLGQLIRNAKGHSPALDQLEPQLGAALDERNFLTHHFYRHHNFRKNSGAGRSIMLADLDRIHEVLLGAYKAVMLFSGIDLDAQVKALAARQGERTPAGDDDAPVFHVQL